MDNLEQSLEGVKRRLSELFQNHPMGQTLSQRVKSEAEHVLDSSEGFQEVVEWSFAEGGGLAHGLHKWQVMSWKLSPPKAGWNFYNAFIRPCYLIEKAAAIKVLT